MVTKEEERNTSEYTGTMNLDIENIASTSTKIGDQYMKLFMIIIFKQ